MEFLNGVIFFVVYFFTFDRMRRQVAAVLRRAGPILLAATGGIVHVSSEALTAAYDTGPVYLKTPFTLVEVVVFMVEMSIWTMGGKTLWFAEITIPSLVPGVASTGTGSAMMTAASKNHRWLDRVAEWHNRQPAPRAIRVTAGLLFAALILTAIHLYRSAGVCIVIALAAGLYAATLARMRKPRNPPGHVRSGPLYTKMLVMSATTQIQAIRRVNHQATVDALREGRRQRAHTFRASKGRGSYRRRPKHTGSLR